ncbi:intermembrane transport protein PqiB [Shewanella sp. GXUN23E]|uniref:intermembrane transport protein PqiB n=1 Tax=Shewanella sp. GXUN23E TaxID=3422498 RepID=UPI003D7D5B67
MDNPQSTARVTVSRRFSAVWIIPIVSLIAAGWMVYQYMTEQGPEIHLTVQTAEGIEPGKTLIKARSVKVGIITQVKLSKDYRQIELTARMDNGTERMLRENSEFWLVKPRIGTEGVSGLETLLSGPYIELRPGDSDQKRSEFVMLSNPPVAGPDAKGTRVMLTANEAGKLAVGEPVMFEGFVVGRVEKVGFDVDSRQASYQLFIFQPYDKLLRTRTRFWLNSGMDITLNTQGFNVQVASLETLLSGGVTFAVPKGSPEGEAITGQPPEFRLYDNLQEVRSQMYEKIIPYVMLFNDSIRGLQPGAPVEYRGIRIGTVAQVPLAMVGVNSVAKMEIPVLVNIELERIYHLVSSRQTVTQMEENFASAFKNGLRATLKTGNLLSGALYVDINYYPDEVDKQPTDSRQRFHDYPVFPTIEGEFVQLQQQLENILSKIEKLPIDKTVEQLNHTLSQFGGAGEQLQQTLSRVDELLTDKDTAQLPQMLSETLQQLQAVLKGYSPGSGNYHEIEQALLRVNKALGQLDPLLKTLNDQPDALIFGTQGTQDPLPVKGNQP